MNPSDLIPTEHPTPADVARDTIGTGLGSAEFALGIKIDRHRLRVMFNDAAKTLLDASKADGATPDGYRCQGAAEVLIALSQGLAP